MNQNYKKLFKLREKQIIKICDLYYIYITFIEKKKSNSDINLT